MVFPFLLLPSCYLFFFSATATTEIYTLSLHDALPIWVLCGSQWDRHLAYQDKWFGTAEQYAQQFEKEFSYPAPYQAAESTAVVLVFADAFERAGSLDPEKVRDAIATTDLMTSFAPIKFDSTGKNVAKQMVLYQVLKGSYKVVAPAKWADTKLVWPRKMPQ